MATKKFSDKYLTSLKPKDKAYTVREAKGFTLKVFPAGTKTFLYIYEVQGKRKQLNLGTFPLTPLAVARKKYNDAVEALYNGEPLIKTEELPPEPEGDFKLVDLISEYIKSCSHNTKVWREVKESTLSKKLSHWHVRSVASITRREAYQLVDSQLPNGKGAANHVLRVARAMFEYAVERGYIVGSPFSRLRKGIPALKAKPRIRYLTEKEIPIVWEGIEVSKLLPSAKRALLMILVTAQRPGEVIEMHRREISEDWWTIPVERALKGGRDHKVFLTAKAKELIGSEEGYIFIGRKENQPIAKKILSRMVSNYDYWGLTPCSSQKAISSSLAVYPTFFRNRNNDSRLKSGALSKKLPCNSR